ncbi:MAG: transglutaminase domain-containing protein [Ruminococcaceae bacterium]|nr:transglutaminase domain-containing protein [Oscillospiraceae bacterium]
MQYDNYQKKIDKVASFMRCIFKHIVKISIAVAMIVVATITVLATKGIIISDGACPKTMVYGEKMSRNSKAFLSSVKYEYCAYGTSDWSTEEPVMPGKYNVRTVSNASFGAKRYGKVETFTIMPKSITVYPCDTVVYGDDLMPTAELERGDNFSSCDFDVLSISTDSMKMSAIADASSVVIVDSEGNDVTAAYDVSVSVGDSRITKRPLALEIGSKIAEYDGNELICEEYQITEGSVVKGNRLELVFDDYVLDVGTVSNDPIISLTDKDGNDVRNFYELSIKSGSLTLTPRDITVSTKSREFTYDGQPHRVLDIKVSNGTLVAGHSLLSGKATEVVNAGEYENEVSASVIDSDGRDVTQNYIISYDYGKLTVNKRPITITTASAEFFYDGTYHSEPFTYSDNLAVDHVIRPVFQVVGSDVDEDAEPEIRNVGSISNAFDCRILDVVYYDVTDNYEITYEYGTITIVPRPIIIRTHSLSVMYDGEEHSAPDFEIFLDLDRDGKPDGTYEVDEPWIDEVYPDIDVDYPGINVDDSVINDIPGDDVYFYYYGIPATDAVTLVSYTTITDVGELKNVVEIDISSDLDSGMENYEITYEYGTLEVTKRPITVKPTDVQVIYNGQSQGGVDVEVAYWSTQLVNGHALKFDGIISGSRIDAGYEQLSLIGECFVFNGDQDISYNYDVTFETGTLEILRRPIYVYTGSSEKMYDGTWLTDSRYSVWDPVFDNVVPWSSWITTDAEPFTDEIGLEYYDLVAGHELILTTDGMIIDVGTVENTVSEYSILSGDDDVTHNYDIYFDYGELTITPRKITVATATNSWIYDDTVHEDLNFEVVSEIDLVGSHSLYMYNYTSIENAGTVDNVLDFWVVDENGWDISYNYEITYEYGTLTVVPRPITVQTDSMSWVYEDVYFAYDSFSITDGEIIWYHSYWPVDVASIRDVGSCDNVIKIEIYDGEENVTGNYNISYDYGTLSVTPRHITVTSGSRSKVYNGRTWSYEEYEVSGDGLVESHLSLVVNSTSVCEVTVVPNELEILIFNLEGDVTKNYEITYVYGTLEVLEGQEPGGPGGPDGPGDDTGDDTGDDSGDGSGGGSGVGKLDLSGKINGGPLGGGEGEGEILPSYIIWSAKNGIMYLRVKSFGDYNGNGFDEAEEYSAMIDSKYSALYLSSIALMESGNSSDIIKIKSLNGQYVLPYYANPFVDGIVQTSDVIVPEMTNGHYQLDVYTLENIGDLSLTEAYASYEREYREFVYQNYLAIDDETLEYMRGLIESYGFNKYSPSVIHDVANYIANSAIYDMEYDRALDQSDNVVIAFLEAYKSGICQHYAASAVMLYRALGIPARYTIGYAANARENEWTLVTGMEAHAWVEIYLDGIGWIMVEVTGSGNDFGEMPEPPTENTIVITPSYQYKEYDGTPLYAANEISVPFELLELLDQGYTYEVVVNGQQTEVGMGKSYIQSFVLYDPYGNDVTADFDIRYENGTLAVAYKTVKILLYKLQKYYDGTPLTFTDEDYEYITQPPEGMTIDINVNISLTDAGYLTMSDINNNIDEYITYTVYINGVRTEGVLLVVDVYEGMSQDYVPIRIDRVDLELTSASMSKDYDGEALVYDKVYISKGTLANGDVLEAHASGMIIDKGRTENIIFEEDVRIINRDGEDVTDNYNITLIFGSLMVQ